MLEILIILIVIWFGLGLLMIICRFVNFLMTKFNRWENSDSEEE